MVSVSTVKYADATADGSIPATLKSILCVAEGKFNPDFEDGTQTAETNELNQLPFRVRKGAKSFKVTVDLPEADLDDVKAFIGGSLTGNSWTVGGSDQLTKPKYFEFTGLTVDGNPCSFKCYYAYVAAKWSGPVGQDQATVALELTLMLTTDRDPTSPKLLKYDVTA